MYQHFTHFRVHRAAHPKSYKLLIIKKLRTRSLKPQKPPSPETSKPQKLQTPETQAPETQAPDTTYFALFFRISSLNIHLNKFRVRERLGLVGIVRVDIVVEKNHVLRFKNRAKFIQRTFYRRDILKHIFI